MRTENDFSVNICVLLAFREGLMRVPIPHLSPPFTRQRGAGIPGGDSGTDRSGEERSPVCLQPFLPNHVTTPPKAEHLTESAESEQGEAAAAVVPPVISSPLFSCETGAVARGACLGKAIALPPWRVPPQLSPRNRKANWLSRKQRAFNRRVTEQT